FAENVTLWLNAGVSTAIPPIVLELHDFPDMHGSDTEVQRVINSGISGNPPAVHKLPQADERWPHFHGLVLLGMNLLGNALAAELHDLQVPAVYPDSSLEVA